MPWTRFWGAFARSAGVSQELATSWMRARQEISKYSRPRTGTSPAVGQSGLDGVLGVECDCAGEVGCQVDDVGEPLGGVDGETVVAVPVVMPNLTMPLP